MGIPTTEELEQALAEAARMREQGEDEHHVAKALLNLHYRAQLMQKAVDAARHYLHSGLAPHEHAELVKAIAAVDRATTPPGADRERFGLE